ncbi:hypothetical protein CKO23_06760 [Thiocystis violacea]|nr:hypothetical protein [Thiocystis violacea]
MLHVVGGEDEWEVVVGKRPPLFLLGQAAEDGIDLTHKFMGNVLRPIPPIRLDRRQQSFDAPFGIIDFCEGAVFVSEGDHQLGVDQLGQGADFLESVYAVIVDPPASELDAIKQARESNEASETVVPTTFVDDAELVWRLVEVPGNTQEQIAQTMGWNTRVDVARYKALRVLKEAGAWDQAIVPTFSFFGTSQDLDDGTDAVPIGTASPFTEGLLRNILDLQPYQQLDLCRLLAKGKGRKGHKFGKADFKAGAERYRALNALEKEAGARLAVIPDAEQYGQYLRSVIKAIALDGGRTDLVLGGELVGGLRLRIILI